MADIILFPQKVSKTYDSNFTEHELELEVYKIAVLVGVSQVTATSIVMSFAKNGMIETYNDLHGYTGWNKMIQSMLKLESRCAQ